MDRKQAKRDYQRAEKVMGIVRVRNLENGRCYLERSADTRGTINSIRFQLNHGAFASSHELCRDWQARGEAGFAIEVIDVLPASDDPARDHDADLRALEELWLERLRPFGERGYHAPKWKPKP